MKNRHVGQKLLHFDYLMYSLYKKNYLIYSSTSLKHVLGLNWEGGREGVTEFPELISTVDLKVGEVVAKHISHIMYITNDTHKFIPKANLVHFNHALFPTLLKFSQFLMYLCG